jgi:hypothetical protein
MADRQTAGDRSILPVRISLGKPKFWPLAATLPYVHELAPAGLLGRDLPGDEFARLYVERLDRIGRRRIAGRVEAIHADYGRPLALCCFEAVRADCHRDLAAEWLEAHGFGPVPEVERVEPAHISHPAPSGQLPQHEQLTLEDR